MIVRFIETRVLGSTAKLDRFLVDPTQIASMDETPVPTHFGKHIRTTNITLKGQDYICEIEGSIDEIMLAIRVVLMDQSAHPIKIAKVVCKPVEVEDAMTAEIRKGRVVA